MNKLVRGNLVRGLPSKLFENDHTCVACLKGKQHKASYKTKTVSSICKPLQLLHMDLFGPVSVRSINRKSYCLVVTDDFSRFSWVFFLATKDETPEILKNFITGTQNQSDDKVKTIKSDNGTEFKNRIMNEFYTMKGRKPTLSFMRPFGCPVTILNTLDHLGKFDGKADDGFFVGYSINSKAFRVFSTRTRFVEENLHINFLKNKPNVARTRHNWMFDIDTLTMSMNYQPVFAGNQTNGNVEDEVADDAGKKNGFEDLAKEDDINGPEKATNTNSTNRLIIVSSPVNVVSSFFTTMDSGRARDHRNKFESVFRQDKDANSTYRMLTPVSAAESSYENLGGSTPVNAATSSNADYPTHPPMPDLEDTADLQDTGIFGNAYDDEDVGAEADLNNLETTMNVSPIPTTRIHKDHPKEQIIGDINSATQTRRMIKMSEEHAMISYINKQRRTNHKDYQNCLFACFLSQMEPKKVIQALADSSWVEAMQE
ncbi:ribonuclease H-like domain-containing protein [Tanacetum coccineum]